MTHSLAKVADDQAANNSPTNICLKRLFMDGFKRIKSRYFVFFEFNHPSNTAWLATAGLAELARPADKLVVWGDDVVAEDILPERLP